MLITCFNTPFDEKNRVMFSKSKATVLTQRRIEPKSQSQVVVCCIRGLCVFTDVSGPVNIGGDLDMNDHVTKRNAEIVRESLF